MCHWVYEYEVGIPVQQIYLNGIASGIQFLQDHWGKELLNQEQASILYNINEFVKWSDIRNMELSFIEYQPLASGVVTLSGQRLNMSNPNLDKQKGCFILNLYDEKMPLEENWNMRTIERRNQFWINRESELDLLPYSGVVTREKIRCYDIPKNVIKKWAEDNAISLYDWSEATQDIKTKIVDIQKRLEGKIADTGMLNGTIT